MFINYDFTNFWDDTDYAKEAYIEVTPPTDTLVSEVEETLGYKLPASYIWLMQQHNGGIPVKTRFPINQKYARIGHEIVISGIMGIGKAKECSLLGEFGSQFYITDWGYPDIGIVICDCNTGGHDVVFLDYRACGPEGEPKVVYVSQTFDYCIIPIADSFEEFICGLR